MLEPVVSSRVHQEDNENANIVVHQLQEKEKKELPIEHPYIANSVEYRMKENTYKNEWYRQF